MEHSSYAIPDDSQEWCGVILDDQQVSGHMEYVIKVSYLNYDVMRDTTEALETIEPISWTVRKRYNDFSALNKTIRSEAEEVGDIVLPGKKLTGNLSRDFILERKRGLQSFIDGVLGHPMIRTSLTVRQFFSPDIYAQDFAEIALQNVFLSFRNSVRYETVGELNRIGWRPQKTYFQVRDRENPKSELLLSWCGYGNSKMSSTYTEKVRQSIARSLTQLQHPHLAVLESCEFSAAGGLFIRRLMPRGSMRDVIASAGRRSNADPKETFLRKYCRKWAKWAVGLGDLRLWTWQVLVALKFLHHRGLAHGSLSASNVLLSESGSAQLSDFENFFLGLPHGGSSRTDAVSRLRVPSSSLAAFDLYSFGHVVYEMAVGRPADSAVVDVIPQGIPQEVGALILSLLSTYSTKSSPRDYPTFDSILAHSFYERLQQPTTVSPSTHSKPYLKFSSATKESNATVLFAAEKRLRMDYRVLRAHEKDLKRRDILKNGVGVRSVRKKEELSGDYGMSSKTLPVPIATSSAPSSVPSSVASTPPPPPPPTRPPSTAALAPIRGRSALLGSISSFEKSRLRKAETVDKSKPRI